jgi:hypothetical protein
MDLHSADCGGIKQTCFSKCENFLDFYLFLITVIIRFLLAVLLLPVGLQRRVELLPLPPRRRSRRRRRKRRCGFWS